MNAMDMVRLSKYSLPQFVGKVAELDGEFYCACCIVWGEDKRPFLCFDASEKFPKAAAFLHRQARLFMQEVAQVLDVIYTLESSDIPTATAWIMRLGFEPTNEVLNGARLFTWRRSSQRLQRSALQ